jgi:hypothetical protein
MASTKGECAANGALASIRHRANADAYAGGGPGAAAAYVHRRVARPACPNSTFVARLREPRPIRARRAGKRTARTRIATPQYRARDERGPARTAPSASIFVFSAAQNDEAKTKKTKICVD